MIMTLQPTPTPPPTTQILLPSHEHERLGYWNENCEITKFTWRSQPEATEIVSNGIERNDFPS